MSSVIVSARSSLGSKPKNNGHWHADMVEFGRGFGFIKTDAGGPDMFLHLSALEEAESIQ